MTSKLRGCLRVIVTLGHDAAAFEGGMNSCVATHTGVTGAAFLAVKTELCVGGHAGHRFDNYARVCWGPNV